MNNKQISSVIAKAIKNAAWVSINYVNRDDELTNYWIAVQDILVESKQLIVDAFNESYMGETSSGVLVNAQISFDSIQSAKLLTQTSYNQNKHLIPKIDRYSDELAWLNYDEYNDEILDYLEICVKHEQVSYEDNLVLIDGIDHDVLKHFTIDKKFKLNIEQTSKLISRIEYLNNKDKIRKLGEVTLALNLLSISTDRGLFVVAYKEITFDPVDRTLVLGEDVIFNYNFATKNKSAKDKDNLLPGLRHYLDVETDYFTELYLEKPKAATDLLAGAVKKYHEKIDDAPHFMNLVRNNNHIIEREMKEIKCRKATNTLSVPLNAFFGNMSKDQLKRSRAVDVVLVDDRVNNDQLRVIYNALVQPITYVQGPPGTGKTRTIINILISAFFNDQKVLVSSNNNKPIDDIYETISKLKDPNYKNPIPLPILRLGNNQNILIALDTIRMLYLQSTKYSANKARLDAHMLRNKNNARHINKMLSDYEDREELKENIESMEKFVDSDDLTLSTRVQVLIEEKKAELANIPEVKEEDLLKLLTKADPSFLTWLFFTSIKHFQRLGSATYKKLWEIIESEDEEAKVSEFNKYIANEQNFKQLQKVFPIILTTNQSAYRLGPQGKNFDLTIIDEAGQCSIGYSLYAIARGERLLLVGDKNQLRPVISIPPETNRALFKKFVVDEAYNYVNNSILLTMDKLDRISKSVMLRYHYRSSPKIIAFSNKKYYDGSLKFERKEESDKALTLINISSKDSKRPSEKNFVYAEIVATINSIKESKNEDVGIITPFVNQAKYLKEYLAENNLHNIEVGTVHTFQGDEKKTIYFSAGITKHTSVGAFDWIKNNSELINVAMTRARDHFVLVGDYEQIKTRSSTQNDLIDLFDYVKTNGLSINNLTVNEDYKLKRELKTKNEEELLVTLKHLLSLGNNKYLVEDQVKVADVLDNFTTPEKFDYGTRAVFDFVIYKKVLKQKQPVVVIELDGPEHDERIRSRRNDKLKEQICKENKIVLRRISNDYSRRYLYIKELLKNLLNNYN